MVASVIVKRPLERLCRFVIDEYSDVGPSSAVMLSKEIITNVRAIVCDAIGYYKILKSVDKISEDFSDLNIITIAVYMASVRN